MDEWLVSMIWRRHADAPRQPADGLVNLMDGYLGGMYVRDGKLYQMFIQDDDRDASLKTLLEQDILTVRSGRWLRSGRRPPYHGWTLVFMIYFRHAAANRNRIYGRVLSAQAARAVSRPI